MSQDAKEVTLEVKPLANPIRHLPKSDSEAAPGEPPVRRNGKKGKRILLAIALLLLLAAGTTGYWYFFMRGIVFSDDARMAGHLVDLAPEINGTLSQVLVREGNHVKKGQVMFRLDDSAQQAALMQAQALCESARSARSAAQAAQTSAQASLKSAQAKCDRARNGARPQEIKAAQAIAKRLENEQNLAKLELDRIAQLNEKGTATRDELDIARTTYQSAQQNLENARQTLQMLQEGSRLEDIEAAKADVDLAVGRIAEAKAAVDLATSRIAEAQAAIDHAKRDLDKCVIKAPFDGWVVRRWLDPGAMPLAAQPVVSVFDPTTLRVDANVEEKYLHEIAVGDEVDIEVDSYPDLRLHGHVTDIMRATNSEFSLIPAEGVSGTFIKVTQRVPIRIAVDAPADLPLGPGFSTEVRIHCGTSHDAKPGKPAND